MFDKPSTQESTAPGSPNIHATNSEVKVNVGLSLTEVEIAVNLFLEKKYPALQDKLKASLDKSTRILVQGLLLKNKNTLLHLERPDNNYSFIQARNNLTVSGEDESLSNLLVELLNDRITQPSRSLHQITLDEALQVAHKLTEDQLNMLTLALLAELDFFTNCKQYSDLISCLEKKVCPFVQVNKFSQVNFTQLSFLRCAYNIEIRGTANPLIDKLEREPRFKDDFSGRHIDKQLIESLPCMKNVLDTMGRFADQLKLYPLGIVIAEANYKRKLGESLDILHLLN